MTKRAKPMLEVRIVQPQEAPRGVREIFLDDDCLKSNIVQNRAALSAKI